ncbi:hypothetical protein ABTD13_18005, partial [Acinetobacter baumannii]
ATRQAEEDDLPGGDRATVEASPDVGGMRPSVGIVLIAEIHVAMIVFLELDFMDFRACRAIDLHPSGESVWLRYFLDAFEKTVLR